MQKENIGLKIMQRRKQLGLTQEELAKKMGYKSKSTINKIEKGINDVSQSNVMDFADALQTTKAYLMGLTDDPNENIVSLPAFDIETIYKAIFETPYKKGSTKNVLGEEISSLQNEGSVKDFKEAMKLYGHYKQASPRDRNIVDSLLKPDESDP